MIILLLQPCLDQLLHAISRVRAPGMDATQDILGMLVVLTLPLCNHRTKLSVDYHIKGMKFDQHNSVA